MSSKNYSRKEWGSLSIQERIKAMNQVQIETPENSAADQPEEVEEVVEEVLPPPRRTSVVDMWRRRDSTTSASSLATPSKTGPREKKISSVSAADRLKKQQAHETRFTKSESKEASTSKRTSVADLIAARGKLFGTPAPDIESHEEPSAKEVPAEPVSKNDEPADLTIIDSDEPPKVSTKRSSVVDTWAKRGLVVSDSFAANDGPDSLNEDAKEEKCAHEVIDSPTKSPGRSSWAKSWEQRSRIKDFSRTPSWTRPKASSASDVEKGLQVEHVEGIAQTTNYGGQGKSVSSRPVWARPKRSPAAHEAETQQEPDADQIEATEQTRGNRREQEVSRTPVWARLKTPSAANETDTELTPKVEHDDEGAAQTKDFGVQRKGLSRPPVWARLRASSAADETDTELAPKVGQDEGVAQTSRLAGQRKGASRAPVWARPKVSSATDETDTHQASNSKVEQEDGTTQTTELRSQQKGVSRPPVWARPKASSAREESTIQRTREVGQAEGIGKAWEPREKLVPRKPVWAGQKASSTTDRTDSQPTSQTSMVDEGASVTTWEHCAQGKDISREPVWARPKASDPKWDSQQATNKVGEREHAATSRELNSQEMNVPRAPVWARQNGPSVDDDKFHQTSKIEESESVPRSWKRRSQGKGISKPPVWARSKGASVPDDEGDTQAEKAAGAEVVTKICGNRDQRRDLSKTQVWARAEAPSVDDGAEVQSEAKLAKGEQRSTATYQQPSVVLSRSPSWSRSVPSDSSSLDGDDAVEPTATTEPARKGNVAGRWKNRSDGKLPTWARPKTRLSDGIGEPNTGSLKGHGRPPAWPRPTPSSTPAPEEDASVASSQPENESQSKTKGVAERWQRRFSGSGATNREETPPPSPGADRVNASSPWRLRGRSQTSQRSTSSVEGLGEPRTTISAPGSRQASPARLSDTWQRQDLESDCKSPSDDTTRESSPWRVRGQSPSWARIKLKPSVDSAEDRKPQNTQLSPPGTPETRQESQSVSTHPQKFSERGPNDVNPNEEKHEDDDPSNATNIWKQLEQVPKSPRSRSWLKPKTSEPSEPALVPPDTQGEKKLSARQLWKQKQQKKKSQPKVGGSGEEVVSGTASSQGLGDASPTGDSPPRIQRLNSWRAETKKPSWVRPRETLPEERTIGDRDDDLGDEGQEPSPSTPIAESPRQTDSEADKGSDRSDRRRRVSDVWEKRMQGQSSNSKPPSYPSRSRRSIESGDKREVVETKTNGEVVRSTVREGEREEKAGSTSVEFPSRVLDFTSTPKQRKSKRVGGVADFWRQKSEKISSPQNFKGEPGDADRRGDFDEASNAVHEALRNEGTERVIDRARAAVSDSETRGDKGPGSSADMSNENVEQEATARFVDASLKTTQQSTVSSSASSPWSELRSSPEDEELKALAKDEATGPTQRAKSWTGRSTGTPSWMKAKLKPIDRPSPTMHKSKAKSTDSSDDISEQTTPAPDDAYKSGSGAASATPTRAKNLESLSMNSDLNRDTDSEAEPNWLAEDSSTGGVETFPPVSTALNMWKRKVSACSSSERMGTPTRKTPTGVAPKPSPSRLAIRPSWASSPVTNLDFPLAEENDDDSTDHPDSPEASRSEVAWPVGDSALVGERKAKSVASAPTATNLSANVKERWRTRVIAPVNVAMEATTNEGQVLSSESESFEVIQEMSGARSEVEIAPSGDDDREIIRTSSSNSSATRRLPKPPRDSPLLQLGKKYRSSTPDMLKLTKTSSSSSEKKPDLSVKALVSDILADQVDQYPRLGAKPMSSPRTIEADANQAVEISPTASEDSGDGALGNEHMLAGRCDPANGKEVDGVREPVSFPSRSAIQGKVEDGDGPFTKDQHETFMASQAFGSPRTKLLVNPMNKKKIQQHRSRLRRIRSGGSGETFVLTDVAAAGPEDGTNQNNPGDFERGRALNARSTYPREVPAKNPSMSTTIFPEQPDSKGADNQQPSGPQSSLSTPAREGTPVTHNFSGEVSKLKAKFEKQTEAPKMRSLTISSPEEPLGLMSSPFASPSSQAGAFTPYSAKFRSPRGNGGRNESYFSPSSLATDSPALRASPASTASVASTKTPKHHYSNSANRYQHKKQLAARKKALPSPKSDAGSETLSFFSGASDASAPASAFSAHKSTPSMHGSISSLASRATHLLKGRRRPKQKEEPDLEDQIVEAAKVEADVDDLQLSFNQPPVSPPSEEKPAPPGPVFHLQEAPRLTNRYSAASRFMDAPVSATSASRRMDPTPTFSYDESHATAESSTLNSAISATSEDNSEWGRDGVVRTRSESTTGSRQTNPMIDAHFVREFNHFEDLRGAYKSVNLQQLAADMKEEVASSFSGVTDMVSKSLRNFGSPRKARLSPAAKQPQPQALSHRDLPQSQDSKSESIDGEEVAIEVEYIGDSYPEEESDIQSSGDIDHIRASEVAAAVKRRQRQMNQATAGQPSREASEPELGFTLAEI